MPFSRDPRKDRRRRVLRETVSFEDGSTAPTSGRIRTRSGSTSTDEEAALDNQPRRSAATVKMCGEPANTDWCNLFPSGAAHTWQLSLSVASFLRLLLTGHYLVYVSGSLRLYGNPLGCDVGRRALRGILCLAVQPIVVTVFGSNGAHLSLAPPQVG